MAWQRLQGCRLRTCMAQRHRNIHCSACMPRMMHAMQPPPAGSPPPSGLAWEGAAHVQLIYALLRVGCKSHYGRSVVSSAWAWGGRLDGSPGLSGQPKRWPFLSLQVCVCMTFERCGACYCEQVHIKCSHCSPALLVQSKCPQVLARRALCGA